MPEPSSKRQAPSSGEECARRMTVALEQIAVELARIRQHIEKRPPAVPAASMVADLLRAMRGRG